MTRLSSILLSALAVTVLTFPATAHATAGLCDVGQETVSSFETRSLVVAICQAENDIQYRQITKQNQTRLDIAAHEFPIYGKWASGKAFEAVNDGTTYRLYTGNCHVQISGSDGAVILSEDGLPPSR